MAKTREQLEAELKGWQTVYNSAKKRGNKKAMENAHEAANKIREEMGTAKTSEQSQAELNGWGYVYNAAKRRGDTEGMAEAHRQANKIRAEQGWEYDEDSGKTYDRIFGPIKRTVNSKTVMQNAKIWDPKDVELYYKPEHYTTFTTTPTRRTLTTPASSYLRGSLNTPSLPFAAARQNDPVYSAALDLTTGKYESTEAQDFAKSFAYGTEKTLAGAAGAVEDALRFASGYGNKLLSGITSLGGLADNRLSDFLAQTAENTLSGSYVDRWRQNIDERYQPTEFQQKLGGLIEAAGAMLPSIAASIATGGLSNAAAIGKGASMTAAGARAAQDISRGIGLATMFPQVAGSSTRQAIQEGANVDSALAYGALSGGLETATESLFAGTPGIAGGRVSQAVQNIIAKATKSPAVSKVADILGEGVEEVISGYVTPYLQRLTYNEQAELASNDELLENFISGVALSGIMQGGSGIAGRIANRSAGQGIDVNSLGENSRKNYIAQMERDGGTTRGFEEQWKRYNDAGNAGIPFDQVNADTTGIGMSRAYAAHAAGMNDYRANAVNSAQSIIDGETAQSETIDRALDVEESRKMLEKAIGKTLPESYAKARETVWNWQAERLRKDTAPSESVSSEQSAETEVMAHTVAESSSQKAATPSQSEQTTTYTPGLVQNNYTASVNESTAKSIDSIAKKVGASVEITDNVSTSGEYRDGVIRINANSDNPVQQIFVHELTHHLEQSKGYSDLVSVIEKNLTAGGIDSQVLRDSIKAEYADRGVQLDDDGANRELVAKYAEEFLFTDEASIQRLANQNRSLARRIKDWIHGMVVKFKGTRQEKALLEAEKKYQRALSGISQPVSSQGAQLSSGSSFDKLLRDAGYTQEADALLRASNRYGTIQRGEMPARDVQLPTQMDDTTRVRRFARTAAESSILTDEQAGEIGKAVSEGRFNYEPIPNNAARAHAEDVLSRGERYAQDAWDRVVNNTRPASKNDIAVGEYLLKQAAEAGDTQRVVELTAQIAAEGTRAGQIVQAMSMLKRLDGVGQSIALDAMLKKMQGDLDRGKSGVFLKVPDNLRDELVKAKGQDQIDKAMDKIYDNLAQQMPRKWSDKWNAWRYLSMLGNPRTHIRNVAGNAMFAPVVGVKNAVGAIIESGVYNAQKIAGKKGIERTKTIRGTIPLTGGKARSFAIDDFSKVQDIIKGGGKMNPSDIVREKQAVFKFKPLESLRKLNFNALEAEDGIFLKQHYVRSMVQYFQANKINLDSFNPDGNQKDAATLQKARDYAIKEAQKATYRDFSRVAQAISNASRNAGSTASILIEGVLPFKKTPINVLKRGIEYSPAGLLQAMTIGTNQLRKGEISANEFIDRLSAGMTGTAISYLGMLLFKSGLLVGGPGDDKEAEFRDSLGAQSYAIKLGDTTYTIDWLAPASMPLFVGAEIQNLADTFDGIDGRVVYDSILNLAEPMTKMSMLDGLNTSISSVRYGDDPLSDMATNAVISYIGQAVPTLFGQISRTLDDTARTTYIEKNGGLPDSVQRALQKNRNKLPGLSQQSIAYRDVFGRAEKDTSMVSRALKNFISPGYFSEEKIGSMESELIRVYQDTGDSGALPSMPTKYFNVNGERKDLTAEEYEKFSYTRGSLMYSNLSELTGSDSYKNLDDADKASVISDVIDLSNALAKTEVSDYQLDGWMAYAQGAVDAGIKIPDFVLIRSQTSGLSGYKDENGETVTNSSSVRKAYYLLTETSLTPSQRSYMYDVLNVGKKVREMSPEKVKSEYQEMYNKYGR